MLRPSAGALLASFLLSAAPIVGAADDEPARKGRLTRAVADVGSDASYLGGFAGRAERRRVVQTAAFGAGILALVALDERVRDRVQAHRTAATDYWEVRLVPLGDTRYTSEAALAFWGIGKLARHEPTAETGRALAEALLFANVADLSLKVAFGRDGPGDGTGRGDFLNGSTSFPSGHACRAFALATVLAERYGRPAALVAYPLAALSGLSRVEKDAHWLSDVVAGAALGHVVARAICHRREERRAGRGALRLAPALVSGPGGAPGVGVSIAME